MAFSTALPLPIFDRLRVVSGPPASSNSCLDARWGCYIHTLAHRKIQADAADASEGDNIDKTGNVAIAALANVPVAVAETMMVESRAEGVLILTKVSGMSWSTVKAIINMCDDLGGTDRTNLEACRQTYERLRSSTAQQVLRFHRMQQATAPAA